MLHILLKSECLVVRKGRTYLIYTVGELHVRTKKCKKLLRAIQLLEVAVSERQRWYMGFVSGQFAGGSRFWT